MSKKTIIVNLFAGAGAGKTTCAWEIASELKKRGIETEYVSEYAKELVWDNNMEMLDGSLEHQQILYHEQKRRIDRLIGKVDVVVTDSPTLLSIMYLKEPNKDFEVKAIEEYKQNQNFNLFINRGKEYQQAGRIHSLQESKAVDNKIKQFLKSNNIYFGTYYHSTVNVLVDNIVKNLNNINMKEYIKKTNVTELRNTYPEGTRIELTFMNDPQAIPKGTRGTVDHIDDAGQIHIKWDNGSSLAIRPNEDKFRTLTNEEQLEEIDNYRNNELDICGY